MRTKIFKRTSYKLILLMTASTLLVGCAGLMNPPKPDYIEPLSGMEFVLVKGGTFRMGDASGQKLRELPLHNVAVGNMAVSIYEVTFDQYDKFCNETGREKPSDEGWGRQNRPVMNISWEDANAYALWMSAKTGLNMSLPTEAQWEYFARAGKTSAFWTGATLPKNRANCSECGSQWDNEMTAPVGSFKPNPWGLYDTAGNVAEWTLDDWHNDYEGAPADDSAWIAADSREKVYRGGAWQYPMNELRSSARDWISRESRLNVIGFRVVINDFVLQKK